jgi:NAD-dependent dihydropyrimidine dehydrogenase PreA subunit
LTCLLATTERQDDLSIHAELLHDRDDLGSPYLDDPDASHDIAGPDREPAHVRHVVHDGDTVVIPRGYHPVQVYKEGCTGCAICALVCPDAAITVYREISKAVPVAA